RQIRTHAPYVLHEKPCFTISGARHALIEVNILAGLFIEPRAGVDGRDTADQNRVKVLGANEIGVANSREIRRFTCRGEKGARRIFGVHAEVDGRDKGSPGSEIISLEETPAKTEGVRAA